MTEAPRPTDNAVFGPLMGGSPDATFGGVLSFMRRRYSRDLAGVDAAVWGIPFDQAVSNRPGARFGPSAIRRASAIFDGDPQYPFGFDPFATLAVIDYGDAAFDYTQPQGFVDCDRGAGRRDHRGRDAALLSRWRPFRHLSAAQGARRPARVPCADPVRRTPGYMAGPRRHLAWRVRGTGRARRPDRPGPLDPGRHPHRGPRGLRHPHRPRR